MTTLIIIISVIFIVSLLGGGAILVVFWAKTATQTAVLQKEQEEFQPLRFRWRYIILPVIIFLLFVILVIYFYNRLPEEVAYHFTGGAPDAWVSRNAITLWTLLPQFLLTLMAGLLTWGITKATNQLKLAVIREVKLGKVLLIMGNMTALPQLILAFAVLDIFSYNSYQIHIMPVWLFVLIVMGLGTIILGIFFVRAISRVWGTPQ
jgi:uncharacterized membrane protein